VAKASAAAAAARRFERQTAALWSATANPDGPGLLLRGAEFQPVSKDAFDPGIVDAMLRLARLSAAAADALRDNPDPAVRRAAAALAARAHPVRAGLDD
jgi:hypothetical protein